MLDSHFIQINEERFCPFFNSVNSDSDKLNSRGSKTPPEGKFIRIIFSSGTSCSSYNPANPDSDRQQHQQKNSPEGQNH